MKGVLLCGGTGSRLGLLTKITNKHLLAVYSKPMVFYPLQTLIQAGITDILLVSGPEHAGDFLRMLGSGREFGVKLRYEIQDEPGGIAQALSLAEDFAGSDSVAVILGDNIFQDDISADVSSFESGARVFLKEIDDPKRFGVAEIKGDSVVSIEEKPNNPKSNFAVTGLYLYDSEVFSYIKTLKPSNRGELEITDVNNAYISAHAMTYRTLDGFWSDAGTHESLLHAAELIKKHETE